MQRITIAGFGGQGVLSLGQFIALAAMHDGKEVTWLPSYGPEMRGGTANCSVVIDDKTVASPVIATPDILIALNKPSLDKFVDLVVPGGAILVNSSLISDKVTRKDVNVRYIDANDLALAAGSTKAANIIMFGAYVSITKFLTQEQAKESIKKIFEKKPKFIPLNLKAFELGYEAAK